jgi:molybdenum cofactor cytidylyltransferase
MDVDEVPLEAAEDAILVHSLAVDGGRLRKGVRLGRTELEALRRAGLTRVMVARLAAGDLGEDEAAAAVARAALGPHVEASGAATGRCNLIAAAPGLVRLDAAAILAANRIDEGVTLASLPPFERVGAGQVVATCKIVPFAVPATVVEAVCETLRADGTAVEVVPFRPLRAGLLQTELPGTKPEVLAKTARTTRERVEGLGGRLLAERTVPHRADEVRRGLEALAGEGCEVVLVVGASATVDRRDVIPRAVELAGGEVMHFGMPVDPGNLTLVGRLPGAALLAPDVIAAMGVGGLLKDIRDRPLPRHRAVRQPTAKR